ncbi:MAG TPA: hypothetical protein VJB11_02065 [archaeon]|nr:hypothetical protein [archaeon]
MQKIRDWAKRKAGPIALGALMFFETAMPVTIPETKQENKEPAAASDFINELFAGDAEAGNYAFGMSFGYGNGYYPYGGRFAVPLPHSSYWTYYPYRNNVIISDPFFSPFQPWFGGNYGSFYMNTVSDYRNMGYSQQDILYKLEEAKKQGKMEAQIEYLQKELEETKSKKSGYNSEGSEYDILLQENKYLQKKLEDAKKMQELKKKNEYLKMELEKLE